MAIYTAAKNAMLTHLAGVLQYASLHTGYPATQQNELSGGGYARKQITWASASGGVLESSNEPVFDVPGPATIKAVGFWTSGGALYADAPVTDQEFGAAGTYKLAATDIAMSDPA